MYHMYLKRLFYGMLKFADKKVAEAAWGRQLAGGRMGKAKGRRREEEEEAREGEGEEER